MTFAGLGFALLMAASTALAAGKLERGKYLVEEVARCQDCHTPRGSDGVLDREKWLKGAVLGFQPNGRPADPPMAACKLTHEDAEAAVAYLKSLK